MLDIVVVDDKQIRVSIKSVMDLIITRVLLRRIVPTYICGVIFDGLSEYRERISDELLDSDYNVIVQQMVDALGVDYDDSNKYDWTFGIECLFTDAELANFCNVGVSVCEYGGDLGGFEEIEVRFANSRRNFGLPQPSRYMRAFSRIGMLRGVLDKLGDDAYFYVPLAG